MPKGRPSKNGKELQFKTVAVPEETYKMISELAELEERSIARQLGVVIKNAHQTHFNTNESLNRNWILGLFTSLFPVGCLLYNWAGTREYIEV